MLHTVVMMMMMESTVVCDLKPLKDHCFLVLRTGFSGCGLSVIQDNRYSS
jgi:hypothetical protein